MIKYISKYTIKTKLKEEKGDAIQEIVRPIQAINSFIHKGK
jgi:hypothetical protein